MSALLDFIPRFDGGSSNPGLVSLSNLGAADVDNGLVSFGKLGREIGSTAAARERMAHAMGHLWHKDVQDRDVQDAAADFTTSTLERVLGPSATIVRGEDFPFIFVPRDGRPVALESKQELPPGWRTNSYTIESPTGQAQFLEPHAVRELQHADIQEEKKIQGAEYYGIKYSYTIPGQWESKNLKVDTVGKRERAAVLALDKFRERTCGVGSTVKKLPGLFRLGDALVSNSGQRFSSGNVDAVNMMLRLSAMNALYRRTNNEIIASNLLAPTTDKDAMENTFFGQNGLGESVMQRAVGMYPWLKNAMWTDRLATGNMTNTAPRWVLYSRNKEELYFEHTETMVFGPFQDYMNFDFVLLRRTGGVVSRRPERVLYADFTA